MDGSVKKKYGDYSCVLMLQDRQIRILPNVRDLLDSVQLLSFSESVSTKDFTDANNYIFEKENLKYKIEPVDYEILTQPWNSDFTLKSKSIDRDKVLELVDGIIKWSKEQDLEMALEKYQKECPDRPGGLQLRHLAALAMAGDIKKLQGYQDSFAKNDRLNFAPMITSDVIDRSLELAIKNKKG